MPAESDFFYYHVSNQCYKKYTNANLLRCIQEGGKSQKASLSSEESGSPHGVATRAHSAVRSPPNPTDAYSVNYSINCIICNKKSHKRDFTKYRISESNRATSLLQAANFFQDDIISRMCDLQDEHAVFGADLYYHKQCMTSYIQKFENAQRSTGDTPELNPKQRAWSDIVSGLEEGLKSGNGYELSIIRGRLNRLEDEHQFHNRDVKIFFFRHFGSSIYFTYPDQLRKSLMVYSVPCNRADVLAECIRSIDPVQVCASVLRQSLDSHDFNLDDRFCDAQDLKHACSSMRMPEPILRFLGYLYNFNPETYPKAAEAVMTETDPTAEDVDDEELDDDACETENSEGRNNSDSKQTADGCLSAQRCRKIQALFQTMYYVHHCGRRRTPMHVMNAESAHSLGHGGKIITNILNRQGLALSYGELRRYQYDIATYTAQQNRQDVALPAHFDPGEFTSAAVDNWDHEGADVSEHDTVCVLFQDKPSSQRFKVT